MDLLCKSVDWFLYDFRHEKVKIPSQVRFVLNGVGQCSRNNEVTIISILLNNLQYLPIKGRSRTSTISGMEIFVTLVKTSFLTCIQSSTLYTAEALDTPLPLFCLILRFLA